MIIFMIHNISAVCSVKLYSKFIIKHNFGPKDYILQVQIYDFLKRFYIIKSYKNYIEYLQDKTFFYNMNHILFIISKCWVFFFDGNGFISIVS